MSQSVAACRDQIDGPANVIAIEAFLKTQEQVMTDYIFNPQGIGQGFSGAVNDIFAGEADLAKAKFDIAEQQEYQLAAGYAGTNEQYTAMSTAIKEAQQNREVTQALGKTTASIAGAGFAASGSGLDILRSGAQQGAIMQAITAQQGLVTEAGYAEQEASYNIMASAAGQAATAAQTAATGAFIGAGISAVTGFLPTPAKSS